MRHLMKVRGGGEKSAPTRIVAASIRLPAVLAAAEMLTPTPMMDRPRADKSTLNQGTPSSSMVGIERPRAADPSGSE
jgi:hypothetical protein